MTKEIRSPNVEGRSGAQWPVRHSDFDILSDFVIRHSGLRIALHGILHLLSRPAPATWRAAVLRRFRQTIGPGIRAHGTQRMVAYTGSFIVWRAEPDLHPGQN